MDLEKGLLYGTITILLMIGLFQFLEKFLAYATKINGSRETQLYQGGEIITSDEKRYAPNIYHYTMYYLILHVLGFIAASMYVLVKREYDLLNWSLLFFGGIIMYTTLLIRKVLMRNDYS